MAEKNVQLKCGQDLLYPKTKLAMVDGLIDQDTGKIDSSLLPQQTQAGITIKYNNGMIQENVTQLNFAGTVTVQKTADGVVKARIGQNQNSSNFNSKDGVTDGTVSYSGITAKNMVMTTPADETWGIGDWAAGTTHAGFNASTATSQNITVTTAGNIHFEQQNSSFTAQVIDWEGNVQAQTTFAVSSTGSVTTTGDAGITCTIASYGAETNAPAAVGNMGKPTFTFDMKQLLPQGGRFHFKITHNNGTQGAFSWEMTELFYNVGTTPAVATPTITLGDYSTTKLSGVDYISAGTINVASTQVSNLNKRAATTGNKVAVSGSYTTYAYNAAHLTDYTLQENNASAFAGTVTIASGKSLAGNLSVNMNASNAYATSGNVTSNTLALLVDTLAAGTTNATTSQSLKTETYRLKSDCSTAWDSTQSLADNDGLLVSQKTLKYPKVNFSAYTPAGPDYSSLTGWRYYIRAFSFTSGMVMQGGTFTFTGLSQSNIDADASNAKLSLEVSIDGTTWYDLMRTSAQASNGVRIYPDTTKLPKLQFSLQSNANYKYYLRVGMTQSFTGSITAIAAVFA